MPSIFAVVVVVVLLCRRRVNNSGCICTAEFVIDVNLQISGNDDCDQADVSVSYCALCRRLQGSLL